MDRSRNEFFSGTGLAVNYDGGVSGSHNLDLVKHGFQSAACAHDLFEIVLRYIFPLLPRSLISGDPLVDRIQEILVVKGLCQKLQCTGFDRSHRHWNVAAPGEKNNRDLNICLDQLLLQIQSAQPGELHIQHQTARHIGARAGQKLLRRSKGLDPQSRGAAGGLERRGTLQ